MNIQSEEELKESTTIAILKEIIHCIESPDWRVIDYSIDVENDINELTRTLNGKRLKINIETVSLNSRARTSALVSGRADVVFWFEVDKSMQTQLDVPEGVILSDPYYEWNKFIHLRLKKK